MNGIYISLWGEQLKPSKGGARREYVSGREEKMSGGGGKEYVELSVMR